jgi:hypothetical protein
MRHMYIMFVIFGMDSMKYAGKRDRVAAVLKQRVKAR